LNVILILVDFIRDPDDPTFHPVRDVLERNVATQLRKITFSAMVYGALVLICLGGVVWSLAFAFSGVLPIHWSSNEPVLEFPIDLLFYNFLMPLAVKFFKPSDGLHAMYSWWFRRCARILRLTSFLFDERMPDEEGHFVGRSWRDVIWRPKIMHVPIKPEEVKATFEKHPEAKLVFVHDGRYVRTPASDLVRIPKDARVFVEVDERNERIDGKPDRDEGLHGRKSDLFKMVYAPPNFRGRIFLFIVMLWLFAAVTGCTITLVPLVFGRRIFAYLIPEHIRKNDIYAFSIGIYILGSASYALMHLREGIAYLHMSLAANAAMPFNTLRRAKNVGIRALRLAYAYTAFALMLPTLFALVIEFYLIVPLHTCFGRDEPHIIYFVQSWTLGLLYVNLLSRFIHWYADTRPGEALRAVIRRGYLDPDIRLATRCFIFPLTVTLLLALLAPLGFAYLAIRSGVLGDISQELVYRFSYPATLGAGMGVWMMKLFGGMVRGWRMRIRDEVYLIGERLHNFGQGAGGKERGRLVDGVVGVRRVGV
jgi:E3 ubiquitin-protein ligase MARCH6